jgi:hypothetical protein
MIESSRTMLLLLSLILVLAVALPCTAQPTVPRPCPKVLSVFPTAKGDLLYETPAVGAELRERFEFRECGVLQVYAFEYGKEEPTLRVETGDGYPAYLFHFSNVLVMQSIGGPSDQVFVFHFEHGKPKLKLKMATKEVVSVSLATSLKSVTISVPPTTYPVNGKWPRTPSPKTLILNVE